MLSFPSTRKIVIPLVDEICNNFIGLYVIATVNLKYENIFNCSTITYSDGKRVLKRNKRSEMNNSLPEMSHSSTKLSFA